MEDTGKEEEFGKEIFMDGENWQGIKSFGNGYWLACQYGNPPQPVFIVKEDK